MRRSFRGELLAGVLAATLAACGGDDGGPTILLGSILIPPSSQCSGCTNAGVPVSVNVLRKDAAPETIANVSTDASGNYDTGNLTASLAGRRAVVLIATVAQGTGIGGVESVRNEENNAKNFDVGTQIACVASVMMTAGTGGFGDPGCTVRSQCGPGDPASCLPTIDPAQMDGRRIRNLEEAASFISGRTRLPDDQGRAACAVINCTLGGAANTSPECLNGFF